MLKTRKTHTYTVDRGNKVEKEETTQRMQKFSISRQQAAAAAVSCFPSSLNLAVRVSFSLNALACLLAVFEMCINSFW